VKGITHFENTIKPQNRTFRSYFCTEQFMFHTQVRGFPCPFFSVVVLSILYNGVSWTRICIVSWLFWNKGFIVFSKWVIPFTGDWFMVSLWMCLESHDCWWCFTTRHYIKLTKRQPKKRDMENLLPGCETWIALYRNMT
jgi:hypothetical protein